MKNIFFFLILFCNRTIAQVKCEDAKTPIVFVHGFLASGDTWATQIQRFSSNGYCDERMFVFDWNTIGDRQKTDSLLDIFINDVLRKTRSAKIELIAHSAGGGLCYGYLKDSVRAAKVAHYVHIGSGKINGPAGYNGNVPTMNIYSTGDKVMKGMIEVAGVINIRQTGNDHLQVASSEESFKALYTFLNDNRLPVSLSVIPALSPERLISGRAVLLGENTPLKSDSVLVYTFNPKTGRRIESTPFKRFVTDENGYWPAFKTGSNSYLEFEVRPKNARAVSYFMEPPLRNNANVYLRCIPTSGMIAGLLRSLPDDEKQSAVVVFSANNAIVYGRDSLAIDTIPLSSEILTPAAKTTIATFLFDDGDGITSGKPMRSFGPGIFLNGVDVMIPANNNNTIKIYYNGRTMQLPCRASKDVILVAIFN